MTWPASDLPGFNLLEVWPCPRFLACVLGFSFLGITTLLRAWHLQFCITVELDRKLSRARSERSRAEVEPWL